jgi:hypothetical protein
VDLVGELTGEADAPQDAVVDAGDAALPDPHVRERLRRQVDPLDEPLHQLPGLGPATLMLA